MTSLKEQVESYGAYHRDPRNKPWIGPFAAVC